MERLTIRLNPDATRCMKVSTDLCYEHDNCFECPQHKKMVDRLAAYEDTGLEPGEICKIRDAYSSIAGKGVSGARIHELIRAEREGRLVVLPFPQGKTLLDCSNPVSPEPLKNFRVTIAYDHCGIVFHQPFNIFTENVKRGYISEMSKEAEAALEAQKEGNNETNL